MAQGFPGPLTRLEEFLKPPQLHPTERCLGIKQFEVEAHMAVGPMVILALGQFTELPAKALVAGVIDTGRAPTIPSPVAEAFGDHLQLRRISSRGMPAITMICSSVN